MKIRNVSQKAMNFNVKCMVLLRSGKIVTFCDFVRNFRKLSTKNSTKLQIRLKKFRQKGRNRIARNIFYFSYE